MDPTLFFAFAAASGLVGLLAAGVLTGYVLRHDEGTELVRSTGRLIQQGAMAFLRREYVILAAFVAVVALLVAVLIDFNVLGNARIAELNQLIARVGTGPWTALAYLAGAIASGLAGFIGMAIAVRANMRTATAAQRGLNPALRVAFASGTVMGLTVVGVGLLGITLLWLLFEDPNTVAGFGFGASTIALFARVGGGIYTKAADVGADLVGKVEAGIPEDDPRNPATIADNVGDNVGDVAGMGADLFESYVGAMIAAIALAALGAAAFGLGTAGASTLGLIVLPLAICGAGILAAIIGTFLVRTGPQASMSRLLWALRAGIFGAGGLAVAATLAIILLLGLPLSLFWVVVAGLVVGQVIGTSTEFFTSYEYRPTRWISGQAVTGHASVVIAGVAVGLASVVVPVLAVVAGIWVANELAGLYGVALAAVGMLSTLGITLATDAYGPVADNAGGLAEQARLAPEVRERTDALDALGNTTAATGKGFAIGSAVLTALALMAAYTQVTQVTELHLADARILIGLALGGMLPFLFSSLTMHAVGEAANSMIEEVRRQFREIPGLKEGLPGVQPDAARAVDISTRGALWAMLPPGTIAVLAPIIVGVVLGPEALGGLLVGSIVTGFLLASFMANAGGAWDNAKKYIELGHHGGKGSDAHAAAVAGDTIGDPFKDTSGPSINILLKLMAMVSLIFGPLFI